MKIKKQLLWLSAIPLLFAMAAPALVGPLTAPAQQQQNPARRNPLMNIPVTGTIVGGGRMEGTLDVVNFTVNNNALVANGLLNAVLYDANGKRIGEVEDHLVTGLPVDLGQNMAPARTGAIPHLELGPLDLDLLGLVVNLNRVVLDIDAETGRGNLLGNLLCAIVGLLDNPFGNVLQQIADLLNRVIDLLGPR